MIPKIIHYIWFQGWKDFPKELQVNVDSVIKNNPDYQIKYWDDESLRTVLTAIGPDYIKKYDDFQYDIQRIDYGRFAVLYQYGGISVDTDIFSLQGFDNTPDIESSTFIVSQSWNNKYVNNATILASTGNPLLLQLLGSITPDCKPNQSKLSCVMHTTGPYMFDGFVKENNTQITVLPNKYFEPCSGADKYCKIPPEAIVDHRHESKWMHPMIRWSRPAYFWCKHYWVDILLILLPLGILIVFVKTIATKKR